MPFGIAGYADGKIVAGAYEFDEVAGIGESALGGDKCAAGAGDGIAA
jgi:hypothetical protein